MPGEETGFLATLASLEQGLAHPMACIPQLMALELDLEPRGCAEAAKATLRSLFERHQQMVASPGVAVKGLLAAFKLQQALLAERASERLRKDPEKTMKRFRKHPENTPNTP